MSVLGCVCTASGTPHHTMYTHQCLLNEDRFTRIYISELSSLATIFNDNIGGFDRNQIEENNKKQQKRKRKKKQKISNKI